MTVSGRSGRKGNTDHTRLARAMSNESARINSFAPGTLDALTSKLIAFKADCQDGEEQLVGDLLHMLTDPIERMRLLGTTAVAFSADEEVILRQMESFGRR